MLNHENLNSGILFSSNITNETKKKFDLISDQEQV